MNARMGRTMAGIGNPLSVGTYGGPGCGRRLKQSRHQYGRRIERNGNVPQAHDYDQYPHRPPGPIFRRGCQP